MFDITNVSYRTCENCKSTFVFTRREFQKAKMKFYNNQIISGEYNPIHGYLCIDCIISMISPSKRNRRVND